MNKGVILEVIGWYGAIAILLAYFLNSFSIMPATDFWYQFLNTTGAIGIVAVSLSKKNYQPAALNIIWTLIGLVALFRIIF